MSTVSFAPCFRLLFCLLMFMGVPGSITLADDAAHTPETASEVTADDQVTTENQIAAHNPEPHNPDTPLDTNTTLLGVIMLVFMVSGFIFAAGGLAYWIYKPNWLSAFGKCASLNPMFAIAPLLYYFLCLPLVLAVTLFALASSFPQLNGIMSGSIKPNEIAGQNGTFDGITLMGIAQGLVFLISVPAIVIWFYAKRADATHTPNHTKPRSIPISILAGVVAIAILWPITTSTGYLVNTIYTWYSNEPIEQIAHTTLKSLHESSFGLGYVLIVATVVIGAPLIEETIYRGCIQGLFRRVMPFPSLAILPTAYVFTVIHMGSVEWFALPGLFVLGIGFGIAYEWTGRLSTPIVMHMIYNLGNTLLMLLLPTGEVA